MMINIAGKQIKIVFDIQSHLDVEQTLAVITNNMSQRRFLDIIQRPNGEREIVSLFMNGLNGANRLENISKRYDFPEAAKLYDEYVKCCLKDFKPTNKIEAFSKLNQINNEFVEMLQLASLETMDLFIESPIATV